MAAIGVWLQLTVGLVLLCAASVGTWIVHRQLQRDQECVEDIQTHIDNITVFRARYGRLPRFDELPAQGPAIISFRIVEGAHGTNTGDPHDYELSMWRGERSVHYASATKQNTCDSGALRATPWLIGLLLIPGLTLCFVGARQLRRRAGS